jgi:hypothetical protein
MASNLSRLWEIRSYQLEAKDWLRAALDAAAPDSPHYASALLSAASVAFFIGEPAAAQRHALAALARLGPGESSLSQRALSYLGRASWVLGDEAGSGAYHGEAIRHARATADSVALARALESYATFSPLRTDAKQQRRLLEESLRLRRRRPQPYLISMSTMHLGYIALVHHELDTARPLLEEARANAQEIDCTFMLATLSQAFVEVALARGDLDEATMQIQQELGQVAVHDVVAAGGAVYDAATSLAAKGDPIVAATLWSAADRILRSTGSDATVMPFATQLRARWEPHARATLADAAAWQAAHSAGARLSTAEALALATQSITAVDEHRPSQSDHQSANAIVTSPR